MLNQCFPNPKMKSSNVLFSPKTKYIQFTIIRGVKKPENIHISEVESEHFTFFKLIDQFPIKVGDVCNS